MRKLEYRQMLLGCDPEFFFSREGEIVGSEKVVSEEGLLSKKYYDNKKEDVLVVRDGVQAEINPLPKGCRAHLGAQISQCFKILNEQIKNDKTLNLDFSQLVKLSKKELDSLSDKAKVFGCSPSENIHIKEQKPVTLNGSVYRFRQAGGHIHIGRFERPTTNTIGERINTAISNHNRMIPLLDVLVGNTCVLMDKDVSAKTRRRYYGQAGEYRTPAHGLEYRTLSNFWLQSYQLMSFVMGMTRLAVLILANSIEGNAEHEKCIMDNINMTRIKRAINNNDFNLALKNYLKIQDYIVEMGGHSNSYPININTATEFLYFIKKPLSYWFKESPLTHWVNLRDGHGIGWESFSMNTIKPDRILREQRQIAIEATA